MKTLNEEINRIKSIMGILVEEESPTNNHGRIIVQGPKQDSIQTEETWSVGS